MTDTVTWHEAASDHADTPNVVNLNLPRDHTNNGAAWVYLPSKDTIYIGPPGSYHIDISHSLKTLVDKQKNEKPVTGVLDDDGYADIFDPVAKDDQSRLLRALQMYHDEQYGRSFSDAERDSGAWDDSGGYYLYPGEEDYEDPEDKNDLDDEKAHGGLDTYHQDSFWDKDDDHSQHIVMKPTEGVKSIHDWSAQDYLDWRDKKFWSSRGYYSTPREDFPHFRWSYGDSRIMKGCPHEGLWVWPTQNGYPDHFSQTGHNGLGNCAQGRIYPHQGDRWEILTWPQRPRNAPSQAVRDYIQSEAEQAVKQYVMEKIGVPEDKIFFTKMHYSAAVSMYNSPSYPDDMYETGSKPGTTDSRYEWEPLKDWRSIPEGTFNRLRDPEGTEWLKSGVAPDHPGWLRFYTVGKSIAPIEIDPENTPTEGWEIGHRVFNSPLPKTVTNTPSLDNENPYDWNPNQSLTDSYEKAKSQQQQFHRDMDDAHKIHMRQQGPPNTDLYQYHKNSDGTYERIGDLTDGPHLFTWDGERWSVRLLTPEEAYETKVRWFEEDEARRNQIARKLFPEAYGDAGDDLDENGELVQKPETRWDSQSKLYSFKDPSSSTVIHVDPDDYELAYRLHGSDWWKSFIPNRNPTASVEWEEVI